MDTTFVFKSHVKNLIPNLYHSLALDTIVKHESQRALNTPFLHTTEYNLCHKEIHNQYRTHYNSCVWCLCRWKEEVDCRLQRQLLQPNQGATVCLGQSYICSLSLKGGTSETTTQPFKTGKRLPTHYVSWASNVKSLGAPWKSAPTWNIVPTCVDMFTPIFWTVSQRYYAFTNCSVIFLTCMLNYEISWQTLNT